MMKTKALQKYLKIISTKTIANPGELLSSNEALKQFGKLWGEYKADVMMMLTSIEYEYIAKNRFTPEQIDAIKYFIGNVALFLKGCKKEHDEQIEKEQKRVKP